MLNKIKNWWKESTKDKVYTQTVTIEEKAVILRDNNKEILHCRHFTTYYKIRENYDYIPYVFVMTTEDKISNYFNAIFKGGWYAVSPNECLPTSRIYYIEITTVTSQEKTFTFTKKDVE